MLKSFAKSFAHQKKTHFPELRKKLSRAFMLEPCLSNGQSLDGPLDR